MFLNLLLITLVVLSIGMLGMGLKILVKKDGKFPEFRVGHNKDMAKLGLPCVKHEELKCHRAALKAAAKAKLAAENNRTTEVVIEEEACESCDLASLVQEK